MQESEKLITSSLELIDTRFFNEKQTEENSLALAEEQRHEMCAERDERAVERQRRMCGSLDLA